MVRNSHEGWIGYEKVRETTACGGDKIVAAQCKACDRILKGHTRANLEAHRKICTQQSGNYRKTHEGWAGYKMVRERTARGTEKLVAAQCKSCERILKGHTKANLDKHKLKCQKLAESPKQSVSSQNVIFINGMGQGHALHAKMIPLIVSSDVTLDQKTFPQIHISEEQPDEKSQELKEQIHISEELANRLQSTRERMESSEEQPADRLQPLRELVQQLRTNQQQQLQLHQEQIELQQNLWDTLLQVLEN